ncbi:MAG: hypothetical protein U0R26_04385 [Solirubrobacterales bacterium]
MRLLRYLTIALPLTALAALVVSGCGGGGSTESTAKETTQATPTLSKAELISQGDAICAEVNLAVGSVASSAAETSTQITQVATLYTGMVERLKRLGTPEDATGYSEFIAAAEELAKVEGEVKLAAEREDTVAIGEAATKAAPALEEFEAQAGVYGFEDCSKGPSTPTSAPGATSGSTPEAEEEGGVEVAPEEFAEPEAEEVAPEEVAPETGGAGGGTEEVAPEGGGESGGSSGGVGPG